MNLIPVSGDSHSTMYNLTRQRPSVAPLIASFLSICGASYAGTITFDVANSSHYQGNIPPSYAPGIARIASATPLVANGMAIPNFSDLEGTGKFWFGGWTPGNPGPTSPGLEFSVTAKASFRPGHLRYTFFSGNWSDTWLGPSVVSVWASTNNFATSVLVTNHQVRITNPGDLSGGNLFEDDLSAIGTLAPGQTLTVRFVGSYEGSSRPETPAGFSKRVEGDSNLILDVQPTSPVSKIQMYSGITVSGTVGDKVSVQYSTNLTEAGPWTTLTTLTLSEGSAIVIDYESPTQPSRLYRAVKE